ncbi:MAG: hypothetical protein JWO37_1349 [Acidimicrobiales bacterium]|jgi:diacylglycerol O-acyltransferase|nr:hypothetical protein [Acidimicrobiales bacterium]
MQRLSGMDASFLYLETASMHMHVTGVIVLDPTDVPGGYSFDLIKQMLEERIHLLPPFRRRLATVPLGLGHPSWVDDPDFNLDLHVRRIGVPSPGSMHELAEVVSDIAGRPLDRARPLWEMTVIEGLEDGHVAVVSKMHHSAIDGVSGAELMAQIFDFEPNPPPKPGPAEEWTPETPPSDLRLAAGAVIGRASSPVKMARLAAKTIGTAVGFLRDRRSQGDDAKPMTLPLTAPQTPFTGAITPDRAVAFARTHLEDFKVVKNAFGTTVNDVVLAACTLSLRHWLEAHGGVPDKPLVASVPVSVRTEEEKLSLGNKVSAMFVSLPVQEKDPLEQLARIRESTKNAKEMHGAIGADKLLDWTEFAPPTVFALAARLYSNLKLADRHRPIHNLVISNIPGPPIPLYCAGARVVSTYPLGPIIEGAGLNITVLSNMSNVDFGAIADRELVPDLWSIADGFADAVAELRELADTQP